MKITWIAVRSLSGSLAGSYLPRLHKLMRSLLISVLTLHDEGPQLGGQLEVDGQPSLEDVLLHLQEELVSTNTTK